LQFHAATKIEVAVQGCLPDTHWPSGIGLTVGAAQTPELRTLQGNPVRNFAHCSEQVKNAIGYINNCSALNGAPSTAVIVASLPCVADQLRLLNLEPI
jgi:hypothetical protein